MYCINYFNTFLLNLLLLPVFLVAQNNSTKTFFDKNGKSTSESQSYYYRQNLEQDYFKSFYISSNSIYFEGRMLIANPTDENLNVYLGKCTWYYKDGKNKAERNFNNSGKEDGISTWYFETGKIWKEVEYANGKIVNNRIKEFDEQGQKIIVFEEDFNNNDNDWDLYASDKSLAAVNNGSLELISYVPEGTSRYISIPINSSDFTIEAVMHIDKLKDDEKAGLIYGFKDWQNYNFFLISQSSFYVGIVYEGVNSLKANGMYSGSVQKNQENKIKIIASGEKNYYSINGDLLFTTDRTRDYGSNIGFAVSGKSDIIVSKLIVKELGVALFGSNTSTNTDLNVKTTGSGLIISPNGYIATNYHVIENANNIIIETSKGGTAKQYKAIVVQKDIDNDLAIIKIKDETFANLSSIPYSFVESGIDVGASVFTIGYPYALSGMGKEAKFTDGKISAKTGYNSALNAYQTSIPVQPGNSGGPVFNDKAELIGIMNAKFKGGDNVSYAIKLTYIKPLIDLLPEKIELSKNQSLYNLSLEEKIKVLMDYVVLIKIK